MKRMKRGCNSEYFLVIEALEDYYINNWRYFPAEARPIIQHEEKEQLHERRRHFVVVRQ